MLFYSVTASFLPASRRSSSVHAIGGPAARHPHATLHTCTPPHVPTTDNSAGTNAAGKAALAREGGLCGSHATALVRERSWAMRSCLTKQGRQRWAQMLLWLCICSCLFYMNVLCFGRGKEEEMEKMSSTRGPTLTVANGGKTAIHPILFRPSCQTQNMVDSFLQPDMEMRSSHPRKLWRHHSRAVPPHPKTNQAI